MYSLDVNFLKDRPDIIKPDRPTSTGTHKESMTPLFIGVAVGLLLPALVGGLWFFMQQQNAGIQEEIAEKEAKLGSLKQAEQQIKQLDDEIKKVNDETTALASVFNQIKPWSAILQDVRERIPPNVQIGSIEQKQVVATAAAAPAATTPQAGAPAAKPSTQMTTKLEIEGLAKSFDDVNYFLLTLQRSPFLKKDETQLIKAQLQSNPAKLEYNYPQSQNQGGGKVTYELPKAVGYTIQATVNDVPASELMRELDRKGAVGLVTRIRTLQSLQEKEKGVLKK